MLRTAFKFMKFDRPKSIGIIVGIVISIFLIGQQVGTLMFITRAMSGLIDNSNSQDGYVWVIDNSTENVNVLNQIDARMVREIRSVPGVENTYPIVVAGASVTFKNGTSSPVTLVGSQYPAFAGGPNRAKIIKGKISDLIQANTVSAEYFDARSWQVPIGVETPVEINGKNAVIKVETKNVQAFGGHNMYTNIDNARFYGNFPNDKVSIIAVKVEPGADIQTVAEKINDHFYGVKAWPVDALRKSTVKKLLITTNMGVSFGTLVVFAIITGFFIIGLTLYSAVLDRLRNYGTYKAIGATSAYVRKLILTQAIIFAVVGFTIAIGLLFLFKQGVANAGLILHLSPLLIVFLFVITLFISVGGSLFAIRKISKLEPASVFQ